MSSCEYNDFIDTIRDIIACIKFDIDITICGNWQKRQDKYLESILSCAN